jgi:hypothetical protein
MLPVEPTTSTVLLDILSSPRRFLRLRGRDLIDRPQPIEGARIANEGQQLRKHLDQLGTAVADVKVSGDMTFYLRVTPAKGYQHLGTPHSCRLTLND